MHVENLIECFMNEKNTKTFLKYRKDVVKYFYDRLMEQKKNLKNLLLGESKIIRSIYELEIERIEYMIKEYLIIRIEKMKKDSFIDLHLLSNNEKVYYGRLQSQMAYKTMRDSKTDIVGFFCKADIGSVLLDGESVEMNKDDFFVGPMCDIYELVNNGDVRIV